ncbi:MAG TPA: GGDEF domain-containing protein [Acidimicrobiales bacterium]|nr:GGDEF domain-containing protein [Acidimicrobiales bacterium]
MSSRGRESWRGDDAPDAAFWRIHIHVGVLLWAAGAAVVLGYFVATPGGPHRVVLVTTVAATMVATLTLLWWAGLQSVHTRWQSVFFAVWTGGCISVIGVVAWLDGGTRSPLFDLLVLPVLFAGLAYSPIGTAAAGAAASVTAAVVGLTTAHLDQSRTVVMVTAMVIVGALSLSGSVNRRNLYQQLRQLADHDGLTGCLTHRAFQQRLAEEVERAKRYGRSLSLVMADVDDLKALNDTNGHHCGDDALRDLADSLRAAARETDLVGRLGGDEFALLLPETGDDDVGPALARIGSMVHPVEGHEPITVSFGAATWSTEEDNPSLLLRRADEALYVAKQTGRARSVAWAPSIARLPEPTARRLQDGGGESPGPEERAASGG